MLMGDFNLKRCMVCAHHDWRLGRIARGYPSCPPDTPKPFNVKPAKKMEERVRSRERRGAKLRTMPKSG